MAEPPLNVVYMICDDLGYGDLACHGNPWVRSPHLDRMHGESTRLTRMCSGPLCTPARASLMTGRSHLRTRAIDTYCGRSTLDPDEVTLAELFGQAGYATCLSGKWHLGDNHPSRPQDLGFQEVLMHNGGGLRQPANFGHWEGCDAYTDPLLMHNGQQETQQGYCTDVFTDHALRFIEEHRTQPFFCYLAFNAPHTPLEVDERWSQPYEQAGLDPWHAALYGMIENLDHNVGRVLQHLQQSGLAERTLVVFTSDHGPTSNTNDRDGNARPCAELRGTKGCHYEGGIRVPMFLHLPGTLPAGQDIDRLASVCDHLPTLAAACGLRPPRDRVIDGWNLWPLIRGEQTVESWPDRTLHMHWHRGDFPRPYVNCMSCDQRFKLINGVRLYDLQKDPGEQHDIAGEHPEHVARLRQAYETWFHNVSKERPDNFAPPPIHLGTPHEQPTILNRNDRRSREADGYNDDTQMGHWPVRFCRPAPDRYRVTLLLPPAETSGQAVLVAGEAVLTQNLPADAQTCTFPAVSTGPGLGRVEAWRTTESGPLAARYVEVS